MITSGNDSIWYSQETGCIEDLGQLYGVDLVKQLVYDSEDQVFYILCNKQDELLGFYLIKFKEEDPRQFKNLT